MARVAVVAVPIRPAAVESVERSDMTVAGSGVGGLAIRMADVGLQFTTRAGPLQALSGCSIDIPPGSFCVVIGPNGCGKSTLLRLIAGLLEPTAGTVTVGDRAPRAGDGRVGLAFQQPRLAAWRTVLENVTLPLELEGIGRSDRRSRGLDALRQVGLDGAADLLPRELSGGMAQRAGLARALISEPPVILLDEPFSALDALTREAFDAELERLWLDRRRTIVLVTHSVAEAVTVADQVIVMSGRPGRPAHVVGVDIPRPRVSDVVDDPRAVLASAAIRLALRELHRSDQRPWTAPGDAA